MATEESPAITPEEEEEMLDDEEDMKEEGMELGQEINEEYEAPIPEEKHNQWTILDRALKHNDTMRTTFLSTEELGRPLFSVRFMLDLHTLAEHYGCDRVATYFWNKVQNVSATGMSNKGFAMNLNVTQKRETSKRRVREFKPVEKK